MRNGTTFFAYSPRTAMHFTAMGVRELAIFGFRGP